MSSRGLPPPPPPLDPNAALPVDVDAIAQNLRACIRNFGPEPRGGFVHAAMRRLRDERGGRNAGRIAAEDPPLYLIQARKCGSGVDMRAGHLGGRRRRRRRRTRRSSRRRTRRSSRRRTRRRSRSRRNRRRRSRR